ncbi:MAG: DUF1648 domain-containing protein [Nitrospira sp.]|nr:DUF1648 domain-containing protein [Nitrospira sp.]
MSISRFTFLLLLLIAAFQSVYYYPQLPEIMASHFDGAGNPNGWSTKLAFFMIYWGMIVLTTFIILGIPKVVTWLPNSLINLPNKDYWLATERRKNTMSFIADQMARFGITTLILAIFVIEAAIRTNLPNTHHFSTTAIWALLTAYGLFMLIWIVRFITRFSKTT